MRKAGEAGENRTKSGAFAKKLWGYAALVRSSPIVVILPLLTFAVLTGVGVWAVCRASEVAAHQKKADALSTAHSVAAQITEQIKFASTPLSVLSAVVQVSADYATITRRWNAMSPSLFAAAKGVWALQLVPSGVVRMAQPPGLVQLLAGRDVFNMTAAGLREAVTQSLDTHNITVAGPFPPEAALGLHSPSLVVFQPIFLPTTTDQDELGRPDAPSPLCGEACAYRNGTAFWGFVSAVVTLEQLVSPSGALSAHSPLRVLDNMGYSYTLTAANGFQVAASGAPPRDAVQAVLELMNAEWMLHVGVRGSWTPSWLPGAIVGVVLAAALAAALLFGLLVSRRRHQLLLEALLPKHVIKGLHEQEAAQGLEPRKALTDCPAELLHGLLDCLMAGESPDLRDVVLLRSLLLQSAPWYSPVDLQDRIRGANLDSEVERALMRQLGSNSPPPVRSTWDGAEERGLMTALDQQQANASRGGTGAHGAMHPPTSGRGAKPEEQVCQTLRGALALVMAPEAAAGLGATGGRSPLAGALGSAAARAPSAPQAKEPADPFARFSDWDLNSTPGELRTAPTELGCGPGEATVGSLLYSTGAALGCTDSPRMRLAQLELQVQPRARAQAPAHRAGSLFSRLGQRLRRSSGQQQPLSPPPPASNRRGASAAQQRVQLQGPPSGRGSEQEDASEYGTPRASLDQGYGLGGAKPRLAASLDLGDGEKPLGDSGPLPLPLVLMTTPSSRVRRSSAASADGQAGAGDRPAGLLLPLKPSASLRVKPKTSGAGVEPGSEAKSGPLSRLGHAPECSDGNNDGDASGRAGASRPRHRQREVEVESLGAVKGAPAAPLLDEVERLLGRVDELRYDTWALAEATGGHALSALGFYLLQREGLVARFRIPPLTLVRLLHALEVGYPASNPYHNATHAADVLRTLHVLLRSSRLNAHYTDPLGLLAAYFAAIVHDHGHPGLTGDFLVATAHPLALRYNDRSPLESHHASSAFVLLAERPDLDALSGLSREERATFRKQVIDMVLATDMKQHFALLGQFNAVSRRQCAAQQLAASGGHNPPDLAPGRRAGGIHASPGRHLDAPGGRVLQRAANARGISGFLSGAQAGSSAHVAYTGTDQGAATGTGTGNTAPMSAPVPVDEADRLLSLQLALKCADIGHLAGDLAVHKRWLAVLEEEFFRQGDRERERGLPISPLFDRAKQGVSKSQVGFFDFVALPLLRAFAEAFPGGRPMLECFESNYRYWQGEQQQLEKDKAGA